MIQCRSCATYRRLFIGPFLPRIGGPFWPRIDSSRGDGWDGAEMAVSKETQVSAATNQINGLLDHQWSEWLGDLEIT